MLAKFKVTERTYYPVLIDIIKSMNGTGVQEVSVYNSEPDIVFDLAGRQWILGVKIGYGPKILRKAFLQYLKHKDESKIINGILLFLPEDVRNVPANAELLKDCIYNNNAYCLLDTPNYKDERIDMTFPDYLSEIINNIIPSIIKGEEKPYSIDIAVELLKDQITTLMESVKLKEEQLLSLVTDPSLFADLGQFDSTERESIGKFLASYIILSQLIFLRILSTSRQDLQLERLLPVSPSSLREAFKKILEINYRPIFALDVLDCLEDSYITDTFNIIWGLKVEEVQHELPGRIYNELMPPHLRKMLAAFFTRPLAADLLAKLSIDKSSYKILDPACGSGTLLVAGYKQKKVCFKNERIVGNPHRKFCEEDIIGMDIMPFSTHLTTANLAALDARKTLGHTQIFCYDSLKTGKITSQYGEHFTSLFPEDNNSKEPLFNLSLVDAVLMNPPFTKIERGIRSFIDLDRFGDLCGNAVGLWGHFIPLASELLKENGIVGAVLPISILRGQKSKKVREFLFSKMTILYIIKPVLNYGFSESAEYRDIIIIAKNTPPSNESKTKLVLFRTNINSLSVKDIDSFVNVIKSEDHYVKKSSPIHIESYTYDELYSRINNLMYLCGCSNFEHRKHLDNFLVKYNTNFSLFPDNYFKEGYGPRPKGISKVLFITRNINPGRIQNAYLSFNNNANTIIARSKLNTIYKIDKNLLAPSLRTATGINSMNIDKKIDYIAIKPFPDIHRVASATNFTNKNLLKEKRFWELLNRELELVSTNLVIIRKINPFSPNSNIVSCLSTENISPSNTFHCINEENIDTAKAVCVLFNSIFFWIQFFLLRPESVGRNIDIRHSDLYEMLLFPKDSVIKPLANVYEKYENIEFPALIHQIDSNFNKHYELYRSTGLLAFESKNIYTLPSPVRLSFDKDILDALGFTVNDAELNLVYRILAKEMMVTRALVRE